MVLPFVSVFVGSSICWKMKRRDPNVADEEVVSSVMKILKEEISCCYSGSWEDAVSTDGEIRSCDVECTDDLNYLVSASSNELGIPSSPSMIYSPPHSTFSESFFPEILGCGLWRFTDYECNSTPRVYDELQEKDFGSCGLSLSDVFEGDLSPNLSSRQDIVCVIDGILPMSIDEETTRLVFNEYDRLPLALKVIGLRLSYDALADFDVALQLCFLYLFSFLEDEVIFTRYVSQLWIREGFVNGQDPLQTGQRFINLLADRFLIEPLLKDSDRK
ncbi:hypothetical protein KI387_033820, partial [Taxus chinensis]